MNDSLQHVPAGISSVFGSLSIEKETKHGVQILVSVIGEANDCGFVLVQKHWKTIIGSIAEPYKSSVHGHIRQPEAIRCRPHKQQVKLRKMASSMLHMCHCY